MIQKVMGNALKQEREAKGIPLEEIARETNIPPRYLTALESEDLAALPSDFYVRYYIKGYLRYIGVDDADFMAKHQVYIDGLFQELGKVPVESYLENIEYSKFRRGRLLLVLLLLLASTGVLLLVKPWKWVPGLTAGRSDALQRPSDPWPVLWPASGFATDFQPVNVSIHFTGRCWVSAARGRVRVMEKTFEKGETLTLSGYQLIFILGNPSMVEMRVNGREVVSLKRKRELAKLTLQPSTIPDLFKET